MADDRLPCCRSVSILATSPDNVSSRSSAISFSKFQNVSSRLTLVLCPPITIERFAIDDFTARPILRIVGIIQFGGTATSCDELAHFLEVFCSVQTHSSKKWVCCAPMVNHSKFILCQNDTV